MYPVEKLLQYCLKQGVWFSYRVTTESLMGGIKACVIKSFSLLHQLVALPVTIHVPYGEIITVLS